MTEINENKILYTMTRGETIKLKDGFRKFEISAEGVPEDPRGGSKN